MPSTYGYDWHIVGTQDISGNEWVCSLLSAELNQFLRNEWNGGGLGRSFEGWIGVTQIRDKKKIQEIPIVKLKNVT
jgi:hypothetical protein